MRFELTTLTLARLCSTPELRPHPWVRVIYKVPRGFARGKVVAGQKIAEQGRAGAAGFGRPHRSATRARTGATRPRAATGWAAAPSAWHPEAG